MLDPITVTNEESMPEARWRRGIRKGKGSPRFCQDEPEGEFAEENRGVKPEFAFEKLTGLKASRRKNVLSDGHVDFEFWYKGVRKTIDVKGYKNPLCLLVKEWEIKKCAGCLVLAKVDGDKVTFLGWTTRIIMAAQPVKDFGRGIRNYYLAAEKMKPMEELLEFIAKRDRWKCNACGTMFDWEAEAAGCPCEMHSHARTKLELCEDYDLWPAMAKAGFSRLTKANIEAFKKGLAP